MVMRFWVGGVYRLGGLLVWGVAAVALVLGISGGVAGAALFWCFGMMLLAVAVLGGWLFRCWGVGWGGGGRAWSVGGGWHFRGFGVPCGGGVRLVVCCRWVVGAVLYPGGTGVWVAGGRWAGWCLLVGIGGMIVGGRIFLGGVRVCVFGAAVGACAGWWVVRVKADVTVRWGVVSFCGRGTGGWVGLLRWGVGRGY